MPYENLLFAKQSDSDLKKVGDFLIRPSSIGKPYYIIESLNNNNCITRGRVILDQINKFRFNAQYKSDDGEIIPLLNQVVPSKDQACTTERLILSKKTGEIIVDPMVGNYLRIVDDFDATLSSMMNHHTPAIFINRIPPPEIESVAFVIKKRDGIILRQNMDSMFYEVYYLQENDEIARITFKTKTNNPSEINSILYKKLLKQKIKPHPDVKLKLFDEELPRTKVGLAYLHQDKTLHAEEYYLRESENKIFAIQTPSDDAISGNFNKHSDLPNGATTGAIYRILNNPKFPTFEEKWIIVTGHNYGVKHLSGEYEKFVKDDNDNLLKITLNCSALELANLIIESGCKPESHINILLYVCYGAKDVNQQESFAKQLARCLANNGISSTIIASKQTIQRFTGEYDEIDEKENECLRYRVNGNNPKEGIVVITGKPSLIQGEPAIVTEKDNQYPDGFYITSNGIGTLDEKSQQELMAKKNIKIESNSKITNNVGSESLLGKVFSAGMSFLTFYYRPIALLHDVQLQNIKEAIAKKQEFNYKK